MKRLLITGSRNGWDHANLWNWLSYAQVRLGFHDIVLVHGAAPGVDTEAAEIWTSWELPLEAHPADWKQHGKAAGPLRNQEMVDAGADLCLAFPAPDSRGTRDCIRRAEAAGIEVVEVPYPEVNHK